MEYLYVAICGITFARYNTDRGGLDNVDYNTLKHFIKVHTTKGQATAIAIPGPQSTALQQFEDELYKQLWEQHDRVGLFVATKADELRRRLRMRLSRPVRRPLD